MSAPINDKDIEDLVARYENLSARRSELIQNKVKIETVLTERRRTLKKVMDEATEAGLDPNKIQEEVQRAKEVVMMKIDNCEVELTEGENILRPMLKEIREAG
jgi:chaperonin cofactor prefoldin